MPELDAQANRNRWKALAVCLVAGGMTLLDVSIVNVALPSLRAGLQANDTDIQLIVAGYSLAFGVALVPAGRLGDARSRKTIFLIGVIVFTLASMAAGLAPVPLVLSIARVIQGIGGGMIAPQVSGFIQNMFQGPERGRAFGLFGASVGIATAIGPLLGGLLVNVGGPDFGWRLVFFVNAPIGVAAVILAARWLPTAEGGKKQSLDPVGVVLFALGILLVLYPLVEGGEQTPLSQRPWWLLAVAVVVFVGFYFWEKFWRSRDKASLIELSLLKSGPYMVGLSLGTFYFAGFTSIFLITTLYLQTGLHYSALQAGLTQMPFAIGSAISAWVGGRLVQRFGRLLVVIGLFLVVFGLVSIDLLLPGFNGMVGLKLAPSFLIAGIGGGLVISPNVTLTLAEVNPAQAGSGGGMLQTAQRVGSAIGVALVLAQFFAQLAANRGDFPHAVSVSLRTTVGLVGVALVLGVIDLLRRRTPKVQAEHRASTTVRDSQAQPKHALS